MWENLFSADYVSARQRFLGLASRFTDCEQVSLSLSQKGPQGEELAIDILCLGEGEDLLLSTSGIHGVEGYPGSAIQLNILQQILEEGAPEGVRIVFVHALNPWGMAWLRRVNENNVDLNRNFLPTGEEYSGEPEDYQRVDHLINPEKTIQRKERGFGRRILGHVLKHGWSRTKQAIAEGQYTRPESMQYGGGGLEEGPSLFLKWLNMELEGRRRIMAIDLHTGLGKFGEDTLLVATETSQDVFADLKRRFGKRVCSLDPDAGVAYRTRGDLHQGLMARWPDLDWTCITQEFGTYRPLKVLAALRCENSWTRHGEVDDLYNHWSRRELLKIFNPVDFDWRHKILKRGRILFEQGCQQLLEGR